MEPRESDLDPRQIDKEINRGQQPDRGLEITRRTFINKGILAGTAAGAASVGWFPIINTVDLAFGQLASFKFAWLSDTHLYPPRHRQQVAVGRLCDPGRLGHLLSRHLLGRPRPGACPMTGVRLLYILAVLNLLILLSDALYNVLGGLLPMVR